jgi:hypothetical protein
MPFAVRVPCLLLGVVLIWMAAFLYEDEDRKIQSKLEEWWVTLDDEKDAVLRSRAGLARKVVQFTRQRLDWLFGDAAFSCHFLAVSLCLSMIGSLVLPWGVVSDSPLSEALDHRDVMCWIVLSVALIFVLGLGHLSMRRRAVAIVTCFSAPAATLFCHWFVGWRGDLRPPWTNMKPYPNVTFESSFPLVTIIIPLLLASLLSVSGDFLAVYVARKLSLSSTWFDRPGGILIVAGIVMSAILGALIVPALLGLALMMIYPDLIGTVLGFQSFGAAMAMDLVDFVVFLVFLLSAVVLALHYLAWPLMSRVLYSVQRTGFLGKKKTMWLLGCVLTGSGLTPGRIQLIPVWEAVKKIFE